MPVLSDSEWVIAMDGDCFGCMHRLWALMGVENRQTVCGARNFFLILQKLSCSVRII